MGMDLFGSNPTSSVGECFRNNVWHWNPLWTYVVEFHQDCLPGDPNEGFYNNGYSLDADQSFALSESIQYSIDSGAAQNYENDFRQYQASLPLTDCRYCQTTGIRRDDVGINAGMPDKELDPFIQLLVKRTHGTCNACQGLGKYANDHASYAFSVDNLRMFVHFLRTCGGFAIW